MPLLRGASWGIANIGAVNKELSLQQNPHMLYGIEIWRIRGVDKKVDVVVLEELHNTASLMDRGVVLLKQRISNGIVNFVDKGKKVSVQHPKVDIGIDTLFEMSYQWSPGFSVEATPYHDVSFRHFFGRMQLRCHVSDGRRKTLVCEPVDDFPTLHSSLKMTPFQS